MFFAIFTVLLVVIDQVTKLLVRANIPLGENVPFIPHVLQLTYVKNTCAAFSILERHTWLLTLVSAVMVVAICWLVVKKFFVGRVGLFAASLILAGGLGNLIDRVLFRYVTDMLETVFMEFPVFNFADGCITVGTVLLFIYILFLYKDDKKESGHDSCDLPSDGN